MKAGKLTKRTIDALAYQGDGKSRCVAWDGDTRGLGLRVFPSAAKSWILSYRARQRKKYLTLGEYPALGPGEARAMARRKLLDVREGRDPAAERKLARARVTTIEELVNEFVRRHLEGKGLKSRVAYSQRLARHVCKPFAGWEVQAIKRADVVRWHQGLTETAGRYEANRCLAALGKLMTYALQSGHLPEGAVNPARGVERNPEEPRTRTLSDDEMRRLLAALEQYPHPYLRAAIKLMILTGSRKGEMLGTLWSDVDLERGLMIHRGTKNRTDHAAPLSAPAVAILRELPREAGNPHLFPGLRKGSHLTGINKAWESIRDSANLPGLRLHDLRRTFGTRLANSGVPILSIASAMNHKNLATTRKHYAHVVPETVAAPVAALGEQLAKLGLGGSSAAMPAAENEPAKTERGAG